jgi:hypothetical protein
LSALLFEQAQRCEAALASMPADRLRSSAVRRALLAHARELHEVAEEVQQVGTPRTGKNAPTSRPYESMSDEQLRESYAEKLVALMDDPEIRRTVLDAMAADADIYLAMCEMVQR